MNLFKELEKKYRTKVKEYIDLKEVIDGLKEKKGIVKELKDSSDEITEFQYRVKVIVVFSISTVHRRRTLPKSFHGNVV